MLKFQNHTLKLNAAFKILNDVEIEYSVTEEKKWKRALMPTNTHIQKLIDK